MSDPLSGMRIMALKAGRAAELANLLFRAIFAGAGGEGASDVFDYGAGSAFEDGAERCVQLVLEFFGHSTRITARARAAQQGLQRSSFFIFAPGPTPDEFEQIRAIPARFFPHCFFNFLQLRERNSEAQRNVEFACGLGRRHN